MVKKVIKKDWKKGVYGKNVKQNKKKILWKVETKNLRKKN